MVLRLKQKIVEKRNINTTNSGNAVILLSSRLLKTG